MQPGIESSSAPLSEGLIHQPCSSRKRRSCTTKAHQQLNALPSSFLTLELHAQLIIAQTERMEEVLQRHVRSLLLLIDEKEAMLQSLTNTNLQLHNKIAQFMQQSEAWKNVAQNNATIVRDLRSKLEEVIAQSRSSAEKASCVNKSDAESSSSPDRYYYGPAACRTRHANVAILYSADSNQNDNKQQQQVVCRVCGKSDVSVLLLPCRHLCLCKICELEAHFCPICKSLKKASLQVYLS